MDKFKRIAAVLNAKTKGKFGRVRDRGEWLSFKFNRDAANEYFLQARHDGSEFCVRVVAEEIGQDTEERLVFHSKSLDEVLRKSARIGGWL